MDSSSSSCRQNSEEDGFAEILYQGEKIGSSVSPKIYDVFINHRGPDVKQTLALELYKSLDTAGIRAFLDCKEMELGDLFPSTIQNAIYTASVQIAIFSPTYAKSVWCLAELGLMLKSKRKIIPIFYHVPPSDLRYVEKGVYADSFKYHIDKGRHLDKLDSWKEALRCVSFMTGYEFDQNHGDLEILCQKIVSAVQREVGRTTTLEIARYPTGIEKLVEDFEGTCWQKDKVIGIYGMGGSGKTTLAKTLFNLKSSEFSASSFLFDVRENKLTRLQTKLLKDLVQEDRKFSSVPEGSTYLRSRLGRNTSARFLLVVDDIDHLKQLDALVVRDLWVNISDNLIIVTTRDERVLMRAGINCRYKMKEMDAHQSTELFCWHAFHQPYPTSGYEDLVESFVNECEGLPLALQVLGGHVFGSAGKHYWEQELGKVRKTSKKDIKEKLRISLESLDNEQMQAFLDIACFFVNQPRHMALTIFEGSGWSAEHTLQILMDKCLVEVQVGMTYWNGFDSESIPLLRMHGQIRHLGEGIADEELRSPRRTRSTQDLLSEEDKGFENVLAGMGSRNFRCLNSIFDQHTALQFRYFLGNLNDSENPSTSLLWLELDATMLENLDDHETMERDFMSRVSSPHTIPSWIPLQNLQYFKISQGYFRRLWEIDNQVPLQLKDLILDGTNLEEFPRSLRMLSDLENLVLAGRVEWNGTEWNGCMRIQGRIFSDSLTKLVKLKSLVLSDLTLSGELSISNSLDSLEKIEMRDVKDISKVSISAQYLVSFKYLHLECMESLIELDLGLAAKSSTDGRSQVEYLSYPSRLEKIIVDGCSKLQKIRGIEELRGLKYLHLSAGTVVIRDSIKMWQKVPSLVTSFICKSKGNAENILQQLNVVSSFIGLNGTVTEIPSNQAQLVVPVTEQTGAIVIHMLVESIHEGKDCRKSLKIPPMDWMVSSIGKGKYIVAVVVTEEKKIMKMQNEMSNWIPMTSDCKVIKVFIITIQKTGQWKLLPLLQNICSQEITGAKELCPAMWHNFPVDDLIVKYRYFSENLKDSENQSTALTWLEVKLESDQELDDLVNLVREIMTGISSRSTVPLQIQIQNLKCLKISGGVFRRLRLSDEGVPFQLKELVLDRICLEEFPNSLGMLSQLESLIIEKTGIKWKNSIEIDGTSFSELLWKLVNLKILGLKNLKLAGELSLKDSIVSTALGNPMVKLEKIEITKVRSIFKISISGQYLHSLKSLHLENLDDLNEVDLGVANRKGCSKMKQSPSSACRCGLENITAYHCLSLGKIKGIEELQGLKFVNLTARDNLRYTCQGIPSHVTFTIWGFHFWQSDSEIKKAIEESVRQSDSEIKKAIEESVRIRRKCERIKGIVTKIPEVELVIPVTEETSAIVIIMLVKGSVPNGWIEMFGIPPMERKGGWRAVAVLVREKEKIKMPHWIQSELRGAVKVMSIISFAKSDEALLDFCSEVVH